MIVLDCESRQSTLDSVTEIFGVPARDIDAFLRARHFDRDVCGRQLRDELAAHFETHEKPIDRVYWFHMTRAGDPDVYLRDGFQPLPVVLPRLWALVRTVFDGKPPLARLEAIREEKADTAYSRKVRDLLTSEAPEGGTNAWLVLDIALDGEMHGELRYLRLPEVLLDLLDRYFELYEERIDDILAAHMTPCAVKFWHVEKDPSYAVGVALKYLYLTAHGAPFTGKGENDNCYSGGPVPVAQIAGVLRGERFSFAHPPWPVLTRPAPERAPGELVTVELVLLPWEDDDGREPPEN